MTEEEIVTETFAPRLAQPGQTFEYADPAGTLHTFSADEDGIVRPESGAQARVADRFGLPTLDLEPSRAELREQAAELGVEVPASANKEQLAAAVAAAESETAADGDAAAESEEAQA